MMINQVINKDLINKWGLHGIDGKQGIQGFNSENFIGIMGRFVANKIE